eukprot:scaffold8269_cov286-Pinguiococcus_pyrenoidosus.AAC.1
MSPAQARSWYRSSAARRSGASSRVPTLCSHRLRDLVGAEAEGRRLRRFRAAFKSDRATAPVGAARQKPRGTHEISAENGEASRAGSAGLTDSSIPGASARTAIWRLQLLYSAA